MDRKVIKYYRRLLKEGFGNAGSLENPSILLDTVAEKIRVCGHAADNHMYVYIAVADDGTISDCKYLCNCDPTANVVVEILCSLIKGRALGEVERLGVDDFIAALVTEDDKFLEKSRGVLELLNKGG